MNYLFPPSNLLSYFFNLGISIDKKNEKAFLAV